ncbi:flagellar protein FlgN [Salinibacillus xinjiangensis]|uniref:Flagellar protein FlgN n=1 Tax=Salinibacillus xinjiangensis TaxID=1229268 RepID=A0A6G1X1B7_9BACI|nr:flagellar protein FlgN [Salinibacillus xinjiangensis]MRG84787.1 flagellar protein FlgN [Salinibacillus xinjiangensis]
MSTQAIIQAMSKLMKLHESLLKLSKEKTELLKSGDMDAFQSLLVNENKHVQAVSQLEQKRVTLTEKWFQQQGVTSQENTVSEMLKHIKDENEKEELTNIFEKFIMLMAELKQQEQLNQELTQQSLQFVELSLDLLQPSIKNLNYGDQKKGSSAPKRSVFDSKA